MEHTRYLGTERSPVDPPSEWFITECVEKYPDLMTDGEPYLMIDTPTPRRYVLFKDSSGRMTAVMFSAPSSPDGTAWTSSNDTSLGGIGGALFDLINSIVRKSPSSGGDRREKVLPIKANFTFFDIAVAEKVLALYSEGMPVWEISTWTGMTPEEINEALDSLVAYL